MVSSICRRQFLIKLCTNKWLVNLCPLTQTTEKRLCVSGRWPVFCFKMKMNFWLKHGHPVSAEAFYCPLSTHITVEPWYNKHLYNEVLGINERDSKIIYMKKDLDMTKPCYRKHILPVPCPFFISKFHCNRIQLCDDFLFTLLYSLAGYETHEEHKSGKNTI